MGIIEFPIFTGDDLRQWIAWLEEFFVREKFTADEKLNLAQSLLEGEAESWFYRRQKAVIFQSWEQLKDSLLLRFGDFADPDRIRLNAKHAQLVKEMAAMFQILDRLEEESITQNQVPVSNLEHSLQIDNESPNVCENSQDVVGCEHQRSILQVSHVKEMEEFTSQSTNGTGENGEHQLFVQMPSKEKRIKHSKGWKFKFKPSSKRTFQCLRLKNLRLKNLSLKKQAHMSRVLYQLIMLHDPGGMQQLLPSDMKSMFGRDVHTMLLANDKDVHVDSLIVRIMVILSCGFALRKQIQWASAKTITAVIPYFGYARADRKTHGCESIAAKLVANLITQSGADRVLACDLHSGQSRGYFDIPVDFVYGQPVILDYLASKGIYPDDLVVVSPEQNYFPQLTVLSVANLLGEPIWRVHDDYSFVLERIAYHEWHRWKHKTAYLQGLLAFVVFTLVNFYSHVTAVTSISQSMGLAQHGGEENMWMLLFWSTSVKKQRFGKNWWYKFKHSLWQGECGKELLEVEVVLAETVVDVRFDDVGPRKLLIQWQNQDASQNSWMLSTDFVLLYTAFKLEDKLRFEGGSIDTTHQMYHRKDNKKLAVEADHVAEPSHSKEALG